MAWCRRSRLAFDGFRRFSSKILPPKPPNPQPKIPPITPHRPTIPNSIKPQFSPSCYSSSIFSRNLGFQTRNYYVDNRQVRHFKPRGFRRWFENPRTVLGVVLISGGVVVTIYFGNIETVPYTKRKHVVLLTKAMEKSIGESQFQNIKKSFKGKTLPAIHPEAIRVRMIARDVIEALQRGLKKEQVWSDLGYASENTVPSDGSRGEATLMALRENAEEKWRKDDEVLDDKWVQQSRKKGKERGSQSATGHLEGLNWEVLVVNEPIVNAFCLPGGKVVVFTGLLEHFKTDAELATIIAHEVAHAVARHSAEQITKNLWLAIGQLFLYQFVMPDLVNTMSHLLLKLPFSRRMEIEADYIGLLLMASAGYDPRVAPRVFEKLGKVTGDSAWRDYLSTHPSGQKRAKLLSEASIMQEAINLYREATAGKEIEGFFL